KPAAAQTISVNPTDGPALATRQAGPEVADLTVILLHGLLGNRVCTRASRPYVRANRSQWCAADAALRIFPEGVLSRLPGGSTTTVNGLASSALTTLVLTSLASVRSLASSPASLDSTSTANSSRLLPASTRTAATLPARTPSTSPATRSMSVG